MSSGNRRSVVPSSSSGLAKRPAAAENAAKASAAAPQHAKKRVALGNLTNQSSLGRAVPRPAAGAKGNNVG